MARGEFLEMQNGGVELLANIPKLSMAELRTAVLGEARSGARICSFFAALEPGGTLRFFMVLAQDEMGLLKVASAGHCETYPALSTECPQAHWFEREIAEQWGVRPEGHPWPKRIRFHGSYRKGREVLQNMDFFQVESEAVHEVAVGPVHAGVIEPGHFRFQCQGEKVLHLEISLGYQHRGVEKSLWGGPNKRTIHTLETLSGDATIGHTLAYSQLIEALSGCEAPARAQAVRGVALELERLANHTGDLGALANDVGYLPTASYCGRLRGDFLNMSALICGNRFGRAWVRPGGVRFNIDPLQKSELMDRLDRSLKDVTQAADLLWSTGSVVARFEDTGRLSRETCLELGLVGPVARSCGVEKDVRFDHPYGIFRFSQVPPSSWKTGDVYARAYVRWLEIQRSGQFVRTLLQSLPDGETFREPGALAPSSFAVSLVEGWRGEICHTAVTDRSGRFLHYKVVDPSFHNWMGLAIAMRNQEISDFPLCNKSFNLSYCGHDL